MHTETLKSLLPIHRGAPLTRSRRRVCAVMIAATWLQEHDVTTVVDDTLNHHPVQLTRPLSRTCEFNYTSRTRVLNAPVNRIGAYMIVTKNTIEQVGPAFPSVPARRNEKERKKKQ